MEEEVFKPKHKQVTLTIDGQEYSATVFLSVHDVMELVENQTEKEATPRQLVAKLIQSKIKAENEPPAIERIEAQGDDCFQTNVEALLEADENLKASFEKFPTEEDVCSRLILSVKDEWKESCKSIADAMPKIEIPVVKVWDQLVPAVNAIQKANFSAAFESARKVTEAVKGLYDFGSQLKDVLEPYQRMETQIRENLIGIVGQFAELISNIHIPNISEERKEELRLSHEKWGQYGWTIIPNGDFNLFNNSPETITEANKVALSYCKQKDMEQFFANLLNMKGAKKSDIETAIFCFKSHQNKPCAMLLFSLLDAKLIRLQRKEDYRTGQDKTKYRASGGKAAKLIARHIKDEQNIEERLFLLLAYTNLFACFDTVFADGKDFRWKPAVINRNFVDHGMWTKTVTRKDCVQLFLLYYNFLELLDTIQDK